MNLPLVIFKLAMMECTHPIGRQSEIVYDHHEYKSKLKQEFVELEMHPLPPAPLDAFVNCALTLFLRLDTVLQFHVPVTLDLLMSKQ